MPATPVVITALAPPLAGEAIPPALWPIHGSTLLERMVHCCAQTCSDVAVICCSETTRRGIAAVLPGLEIRSISAELTGLTLRRTVLQMALEITGDSDALLIAEAERGLTPASQLDAVVAAVARDTDVVLPVIDMTDSVKSWDHQCLRNVDRSTLAVPQSPHWWRRSTLEQVLAHMTGADERAGEVSGEHTARTAERRATGAERRVAQAGQAIQSSQSTQAGHANKADQTDRAFRYPEIETAQLLGARIHLVNGSLTGGAVHHRMSYWHALILGEPESAGGHLR